MPESVLLAEEPTGLASFVRRKMDFGTFPPLPEQSHADMPDTAAVRVITPNRFVVSQLREDWRPILYVFHHGTSTFSGTGAEYTGRHESIHESIHEIAEGLREPAKRESTADQEKWKFESRLLASIDSEGVEDGYSHPAETIIEEAFAVSGEVAESWIESVVVSSGPASASAVLKCLGRIDSPGSECWRVNLIRNALVSPEVEVRDAAVQAAELWGSEALAGVLKAHSEKVPWLADYIRRVIDDIG